MSEILFEALPVADATRFAAELAARETGGLAQFLPNRPIDGFRTRVTRVSRTTQAAKFRSFDAETPIGKRPVAATVTDMQLAPISQKLPLREQEILQKALKDGSLDAAPVVDALYDDTENNVGALLNRAEQLRGEFLFSGALSIEENGFIQEADFGLPADHDLSVSDLDAAWDATGATPLTDELEWVDKVREDSGEEPIATIGSARIRRALMHNAEYATALGAEVGFITVAQFNQVRADMGLPPFVVYDGKVGGVRVTPDDKIAIVTATVGETQWGDTVEALELIGSKAVESARVVGPKICASAWKTTDPVNLWSKASATMLTVAGDINGLFVAEVLTQETPAS